MRDCRAHGGAKGFRLSPFSPIGLALGGNSTAEEDRRTILGGKTHYTEIRPVEARVRGLEFHEHKYRMTKRARGGDVGAWRGGGPSLKTKATLLFRKTTDLRRLMKSGKGSQEFAKGRRALEGSVCIGGGL